jgi:gamma-glutamylcyclotransferase (GGCT)/AIG2-like uncharacterized protein YtfP
VVRARKFFVSQFIFIYGTLRPGLAPDEVARAVGKLRLVGEGSVRGVLYDPGDYPGAVVDSAAESRIFGTVFELPVDESVLRELDRYEGFNPEAAAESLFVRVEHAVELADVRTIGCWIYVYNLEPVGARVVQGGRYRKGTVSWRRFAS